MVVRMRPDQLPRALRAEGERIRRAIPKAARAAAQRFKARLVARTDELGITDTGILKNSWRVTPGGDADGAVATVYSDAPHAGVVELGARPHVVSLEGRESIARWAMRKLGLDEKEAERASFAIAKKLELVGQKPRYLVRDALPDARRYFAEELVRVMSSGSPATGAAP